MIYEVYTVRDAAVKSYMQPFFVRSRGEAVRSFTDAVNNETHEFHKHSNDYVLYCLGSFDDTTGRFVSIEPDRVVAAHEVLVDDVFPPEKRLPRQAM